MVWPSQDERILVVCGPIHLRCHHDQLGSSFFRILLSGSSQSHGIYRQWRSVFADSTEGHSRSYHTRSLCSVQHFGIQNRIVPLESPTGFHPANHSRLSGIQKVKTDKTDFSTFAR